MYEADFQLELDAIEAESIGWLALGEGAYIGSTTAVYTIDGALDGACIFDATN